MPINSLIRSNGIKTRTGFAVTLLAQQPTPAYLMSRTGKILVVSIPSCSATSGPQLCYSYLSLMRAVLVYKNVCKFCLAPTNHSPVVLTRSIFMALIACTRVSAYNGHRQRKITPIFNIKCLLLIVFSSLGWTCLAPYCDRLFSSIALSQEEMCQ